MRRVSAVSAVSAVGLGEKEQAICLQCREPIGPGSREITVRSTGDGRLALVHQDCLNAWQRKGPAA